MLIMLIVKSTLKLILATVVISICVGKASGQQPDQEKGRKRNNFIAFEVMRLICTVEITYQGRIGKGVFGNSEELFQQDLIGADLASALGVPKMKSKSGEECTGEKKPFHGYFFRLEVTSAKPEEKPKFTAVGFPALATGESRNGDYSFFIDVSGLIRVSTDPKELANAKSVRVGEPGAPAYEEVMDGIEVTIGEGSLPGQLFPDGTVCIVDAKDPSRCNEILFKVPGRIMKKMQGEDTGSTLYGIFDLDNDGSPEVVFGYWLPRDPDCFQKVGDDCVNLFVYKKVGKNYRLYSKLQAPTMGIGYDPAAWFFNESPRKAIFMTRYQGSSGRGLFYLNLKKRSLKLITDDIGVIWVFCEDIDKDGVKEIWVVNSGPAYNRLGGGLLRWRQGIYRLQKLWWPEWDSSHYLDYVELINLVDKQKGIIAVLGSGKERELAVFKITKGAFAIVDKVKLPESASFTSDPEIVQTSHGAEIYIPYQLDGGKMETLKCVYQNGKITCSQRN